MKITLNIDKDLLEKAMHITAIKDVSVLVKLGLEILIEKESANRLAILGGSEKGVEQISRRKSQKIKSET